MRKLQEANASKASHTYIWRERACSSHVHHTSPHVLSSHKTRTRTWVMRNVHDNDDFEKERVRYVLCCHQTNSAGGTLCIRMCDTRTAYVQATCGILNDPFVWGTPTRAVSSTFVVLRTLINDETDQYVLSTSRGHSWSSTKKYDVLTLRHATRHPHVYHEEYK